MSERWLALRDLAEEEDEGKRRVMIGKDRSTPQGTQHDM